MRIGSLTSNDGRPLIMGVLNVTPDSFFDGGRCFSEGQLSMDAVLRCAEQMLNDGADLIDVGGESTRPGAASVSEQQECDRVLPVVEAIVKRFSAAVSVDTSRAAVIREGARLGAGLINDVRALQGEGALAAAVEAQVPVCLMHMQGAPQTMQSSPAYVDVVEQVYSFLQARVRTCVAAGVDPTKVLVDPGIGFGKADEHNLALIRQLQKFTGLGPVLIGVSRKSMFGRLLGRDLQDRLPGSLAVALIAMQQGASIVRVHDVAATRDVVTMFELLNRDGLKQVQ